MYKVKDNAEAQLQFGISSVATTLVVKEGQGDKFPGVPFLVVLNKRNSDWEITKSEKIEVTAKNWDQLTVKRGFEWTTPSDFSADDFVSLFVLARHIEDLQTEVDGKANQTDLDSVSQRTTTLEEKVSQTEEKVGKLEEAGTPDHLSIKEIIWEKYKNSDLLTRAYLPLSANSDIPLNFGETATNKELHIQRISSGHTDNKIKVKLKKTWNPTSNVTIEVRKGVKVESGDIVYRYGGEVLATATIQANQITTSRKEFTANLNKSPLLARGELYSIVIKCQGSVYHNADFYQIACSGERSEAFCAVQVNDNSRVRTDYMPYCESSMFLDYCLAKRSDATKETVLEVINLTGSSSYEHYFTLTEDNQKIAIHSTWREIERVYFYNGGTQIWSMWYWASGSVELSAKKWDTIRIQIRVRVASGVNITVYRRLKKPCPKILYPKELKNVGEVVECTIYWLHNNVFVWDQIDTTPSLSATTGRLTLGNAVAFFSIIGNDGKTYKFPVYWA